MDSSMSPGDRIKLYRERAGLTQEHAAQLMGVSVHTWRKWESGQRHVVSIADWIDIARILRVRDLFALTGLPVGQLPDDPPEHPALPAVRAALVAPPSRPDVQPDPAKLLAAVNFAHETWHTSVDNHSRLGVMLPDLITAARSAWHETADRTTADALTRLWMLVRSWSKWVGAHDLSMLAAERGVASAAGAGNPATVGAAAWSAGMTLSTRGWAEESVRVIRAAVATLEQHTDDGDTLAMLGALHLAAAIQHTRLRDERHAADAVETAGRIAERTGERNIYRTVFGPTNVQIYLASIALDRSQLAEAIRLSERIDVAPLPSMERRYAALFTLGRAHSLRGDDLAAAVVLDRAAREYPQGAQSQPPFRAVLRHLLARETPTTRPVLRPLAERLHVD